MENLRINLDNVSKRASIYRWYLTNQILAPVTSDPNAESLLNIMYHFKYNSKLFSYPAQIHNAAGDHNANNSWSTKSSATDCSWGSAEKMFEKMFKTFKVSKIEQAPPKKLENLGIEDVLKWAFIKIKSQFKTWNQVAAFLVALYYFIGYILMVTKFVNKNRHEMIAFWPCSLYRKFFGKK